MAKIVVIGASGFVGKNLIPKLEGHDLHCPKHVRVDVTNGEKIKNYFKNEIGKVDFLINLGAKTPSKPECEPIEYYESNSIGTYNLCKHALYDHFIHTSTHDVYGNYWINGKYAVTDPCLPATHYAMSKLASENWVRLLANHFTILRFSCLYGCGGLHKLGSIPEFLRQATEGNSIKVWGKGKGSRDYLFVMDAVNAILKVIENNYVGGIFNVGYGKPISKEEIALEISKLSDCPIEYANEDWQDFRKYLDISRTETFLDWKPETDWKEGIKKTFECWKANSFIKENITKS